MNILVIGKGGREHAIIWKLRQSPQVDFMYCAPGNAGISQLATCVDIKETDIGELKKFARKNSVDLTVVGPETPLAAGIVDVFQRDGLVIFGPTRAAARLETSKAFAKDFMKRYEIPTAGYAVFQKPDFERARSYLQSASYPLVLKADGLAAGKGVLIADDYADAVTGLEEMMLGGAFGSAGETVVIEEFLHGVEASVFAITDGKTFATLAPAQDHKRIFDGDKGKNTGGMGAYAPAPAVKPEILSQVKLNIIKPVLRGMEKEGTPYQGTLYCGLMLTADGPKVMEFNCRFGDPETQVVLPLIDDDLADILYQAATGKLRRSRIKMHDACAVCVIMASSGYPDSYKTGKRISGLETIDEMEDGVAIFHAGTALKGGTFYTAGGRVLGVTAVGRKNELRETIVTAYNAVQRITFDGAYYRTDIGAKAFDT